MHLDFAIYCLTAFLLCLSFIFYECQFNTDLLRLQIFLGNVKDVSFLLGFIYRLPLLEIFIGSLFLLNIYF